MWSCVANHLLVADIAVDVAIEHERLSPSFRQPPQIVDQQMSFGRIVALHIDEQQLRIKCRKDLVERRHQPDALAAEGESLTAIRRMAIADVERPQI